MVSFDLGIDPRRFGFVRYLLKYLSEDRRFRRLGGKITGHWPVFSDYRDEAGVASGHYFHQDLLVASFVHSRAPERHVDIASSINGFVAHVASFRKIEVMDIRALRSTGHSNIQFLQADLMDRTSAPAEMTDSISCLHAIEHFGLGRYGDPLDPDGHRKGFRNIVRMLKPNGTLYISFPIGRSNQVHFNAHRVFHPRDIFTWLEDPSRLELQRFDYVDDAGGLHQNVDLTHAMPSVRLGCGIYTFRKIR
jgi:SAM-dependent methyltransferase